MQQSAMCPLGLFLVEVFEGVILDLLDLNKSDKWQRKRMESGLNIV